MGAAAKMGAAAEMEVSHLLALHGKCRDTDPDVAVPKTTGVLREKPPRTSERAKGVTTANSNKNCMNVLSDFT